MTLLAVVSTASAYMAGVITSIVLILVSGFIAKSIPFKPDLSDVKKRKFWFWCFHPDVVIFLTIYKRLYNF